jgi:hypothetical protein
MTTQKTIKRKAPKKADSNEIKTTERTDEERAFSRSRALLHPSMQAAVSVKMYSSCFSDLSISSLIDSLIEQTCASSKGDLTRGEDMLTAQAHTLDAMFNTLAQRAGTAKCMDNLDRYLKLALRAQAQCRATWEALANIKNPPMVGYVRQANIAHGPQQVNNAIPASEGTPRARKKPNLKNKLLEEKDGERLDTGSTCTSGQANPEMATVGEVNGTEDEGR